VRRTQLAGDADECLLLTTTQQADGTYIATCWWTLQPVWADATMALGFATAYGPSKDLAERRLLAELFCIPEIRSAA